jgi:hypothetical protein
MIWAPLFSELSQLFGVSLLKNSGKRNKFNNTFFFTQLWAVTFSEEEEEEKEDNNKKWDKERKISFEMVVII